MRTPSEPGVAQDPAAIRRSPQAALGERPVSGIADTDKL